MEIEDFFAQAVDRLLTGESIDDIVVSYAPSIRVELRGLLVVVEAAERMATATVPAPASLNRVSARLLFAQRTAELRAGLAAVSTTVPAAPSPSTGSATGNKPGLWQRLRDGWDAIRPPAPLLRLAPLTSVLIVAFLLTFTVVVSAQESLPGDQFYQLKEWMFNQRLATAPPELLATEREIIAKEQEEDVGKTAAELNARPEADAAEAVGIFQYFGEDVDFMYFGNLLVTKGYRTDMNDPDTWTPMSGNGELQPGGLAMLRYQIVPGMMGVVEGINFEVMQEPPQPTPIPTPTPTPLPGGGCQRVEPRGWTAYSMGANETLRDIAARSNVSSEELRKVNCLTNGPVSGGTTIYVPARIAAPPQPLQPVITVTPTPTTTPVPPTAPPTVTPTGIPGAEATATEPAATATESATVLPSATATQAAAETPGAGVTASATPTDTASTPTDETTPGATKTPSTPVSATPANGTATPVSGTDTPGTATATPPQSKDTPAANPTTGTETGTPSTELPPTGTSAPESSTTPPVSATATGVPTGAASPIATAISSPQATATPISGVSPSATTATTATSAPTPTTLPPTTLPPTATATSSSAATVAPTATKIATPTATEVSSSANGGSSATSTPAVTATPTSIPPTATLLPTATKPPPATATPVPPPPTATPVPPQPTATPPPPATTAASTSDSSDSP